VTILNSHSVSSSEAEFRNGTESWKALLLSSAERQEATGGLYSQITNLTLSNGILKGKSLNAYLALQGSFFSGDYLDILKGEFKTHVMAQSSLLTRQCFLICKSIVYDLNMDNRASTTWQILTTP
jgi:hypothetical protein